MARLRGAATTPTSVGCFPQQVVVDGGGGGTRKTTGLALRFAQRRPEPVQAGADGAVEGLGRGPRARGTERLAMGPGLAGDSGAWPRAGGPTGVTRTAITTVQGKRRTVSPPLRSELQG